MSKPVTLKSNRDDSDRFDDVKLICSFLANSQVHKITLYTLKGFYILNVINNCLNLHRFLHRFFYQYWHFMTPILEVMLLPECTLFYKGF